MKALQVRNRRDKPPVVNVAEHLALLTSRRQFLRRVLEGTFVLGASSALLGGVFAGRAGACTGTICSRSCGPSPCCPTGRCGSGGACGSGCKARDYGTFTCGSSGSCWSATDPCTLCVVACCDCCCTNLSSGNVCSSCGATGYRACICAAPVHC